MENQAIKRNPNPNGKRIVGAAILLVGVALLVKQFDLLQFPSWLFSWPMILIVIGLASGVKHNFTKSGSFIMILIGSVFILEKMFPELNVGNVTWPIILIGIGIWFIFGKGFKNNGGNGRNKWRENFDLTYQPAAQSFDSQAPKNEEPVANDTHRTTGDEYLDSVSVFGGTKKNILSKSFKGGEIVTIMGGCEINFSHADINGTVVLDVTQIMGGTKIIIPPTWDVVTEMSAIFGGVEDKRSLVQVLPDRSKVLLIKGTSIFAGIDIRNY
jgi:predicted membrane protein